MQDTFKLLFIGDIVGRSGRRVVEKFLVEDGNAKNYDFIIANVENASHGFGLTLKNHNELLEAGIDCMTSGNHIWDKKDIFTYIDESPAVIRPLNYHESVRGVGYREFLDGKIIVINLLGKTFMQPTYCPFLTLNDLSKEISFQNKIVIIDFHAEATSEKAALAYFLEGKVNAVVGTHTHVQTNDARILPNGTAFITDLGMTAAEDSILGVKTECILYKFKTHMPCRFEQAEGKVKLCGALIEIDDTSCIAKSIKCVNI